MSQLQMFENNSNIHEYIKSLLNLESASQNLVQNILSSCHLHETLQLQFINQ
jgi:TATA-box binding protein (TBP) (component of TFIID and TFIIIB)